MQQSLARRYRPALFKELVGQDGAAKALTSAIRLGRIPQGVLFTGVRGVGKTTTARLYAKALNCEARGDDSEPCNTCDSCVAISKGAHEDVLEIDGASNTGVGDVRALQETIAYVPQRSRYRVYIIDEVHMLSQAAFNALLKTLEEPPSHVVFVFATTELDKVPATIVGRCQTFHLSKLPFATIRQRLVDILSRENIKAEDKALALIAREGHGSMRDALTLLDQAIAIGGGQVTLASLGPLVSKLSSSPYFDLLTAFVSKDAQKGLRELERLDAQGVIFANVIEQVAAFARHAFVVRDLGSQALDTALLGLDDDEVMRLAAIARDASPLDLNRIFRTLVRCRADLDGSAIDRYIVENYLFEWCFDPGLPDLDTLLRGGPNQAGEPASSAKPRPAPSQVSPTGAAPVPRASKAPAKSLLAALNESLVNSPAAPSDVPKASMATTRPTEVTPSLKSVPVGENTSQPAPAKPTPISTPGSHPVFPETWRALVDAWKREKPLQARKLEDTHPVRYTADEITIAVYEHSPSSVLLAREEQQRIKEQFRELFGFSGSFAVVQAEAALSKHPTSQEETSILPDTILTQRERETKERRQRLREETETGAFAKEALAVLGGKVEDIVVR